ncbi:MAG: glutathione S-transferase family protein [Alphaproteobacteria bacterium]|nr:MAG: glutathione S-transferase family protein [Alphaproteobacteria bacterium]
MRKLYYWWLCPLSRKVRVMLGEARLPHDVLLVNPWDLREDFLQLNPSGILPVFIEEHNITFCDSQAICEYLDESYALGLIGRDPLRRAEVRRLVAWFDQKFYNDVWQAIIFEKSLKSKCNLGNPDAKIIREGNILLTQHLDYITSLLTMHDWLAGEALTLADITAAAHLSCVDYLGHIFWANYPQASDWYARVKSRPSFRPLLKDRVPALIPSPHYSNLDF